MAYDWKKLLKAMPVIAASIDPRAGMIAEAVDALLLSELAKAQAVDPNVTIEDLTERALADLAQSDADFDEGLRKARELRQKGHEPQS